MVRRVAIFRFAGFIAQRRLLASRELVHTLLLARKNIIQAAEFRLELTHPLCLCRWFSASHGEDSITANMTSYVDRKVD